MILVNLVTSDLFDWCFGVWCLFLCVYVVVICELEWELSIVARLLLSWYDVLLQLVEVFGWWLWMVELVDCVLLLWFGFIWFVDCF